MKLSHARRLAPLLAGVALAAPLAACGNDDESAKASGNGTDLAFAQEMVPHHKSAVEMAEVAQQRAERPAIKRLAGQIIASQTAEISTMNGAITQLQDAGVKPIAMEMPAQEKGMDMDAGMLEDAKPFDRAFIDMMVPHHQGAIRMARVELDKGQSPRLTRLADAIVAAQAKEIKQMNRWRTEWYGKPSPAGGVPAEGMMGADHHG